MGWKYLNGLSFFDKPSAQGAPLSLPAKLSQRGGDFLETLRPFVEGHLLGARNPGRSDAFDHGIGRLRVEELHLFLRVRGRQAPGIALQFGRVIRRRIADVRFAGNPDHADHSHRRERDGAATLNAIGA